MHSGRFGHAGRHARTHATRNRVRVHPTVKRAPYSIQFRKWCSAAERVRLRAREHYVTCVYSGGSAYSLSMHFFLQLQLYAGVEVRASACECRCACQVCVCLYVCVCLRVSSRQLVRTKCAQHKGLWVIALPTIRLDFIATEHSQRSLEYSKRVQRISHDRGYVGIF